MLKIGIRGHDLPGAPFDTPEQFIEGMKSSGLQYVQLAYQKAYKNFNCDDALLEETARLFDENGIGTAFVGGYFNMIHPDEAKRLKGYAYFEYCMRTAHLFHTPLVGSETGSANGDKWTYHPYNHTDEAYRRVVETVRSPKAYGEAFGTRPIIEGAYGHTIYKPSVMKKLIEETGITDVTVDIFNYLNPYNYAEASNIFDECLELFGDKIRIFHIKDFHAEPDKLVQCAAGDGELDWLYMIGQIKKHCPDAYLILEGIRGDDIAKSVNYLRRLINE